MKWCFLANDIDLMVEFFGKLSKEILKNGDECLVVFNSKIAEYKKRRYFPEGVKFISKTDWTKQNYKKDAKFLDNVSWKDFYPSFERKTDILNLDYKNSYEIINQLYQFFDYLFKAENPDLVINEAPANIFNITAYNLCKKSNIAYIGLVGSRFDNKIDVYDQKSTCSLYEKTYNELKNSGISAEEQTFAEKFIEEFVSHKKQPSYMEFQKDFYSSLGFLRYFKRLIKNIPALIKYILKRKKYKKFDYESEAVLFYNIIYPWIALKRKIRAIFSKKYFEFLQNEDKFFFFPLHLQPEASTSVQATYFSDQLNTIKNAAFSLPFPYKLYVKEHPVAVGTRPFSFYKTIKKLPNVVLISPQEKTEELVKKSIGIITLTSTVGMEAVLAGKPVYVLGEVFYTYHPLCFKVESFEQLRRKVIENLPGKLSNQEFKIANENFIISYYRNVISGDVVNSSQLKDNNNYLDIYKKIKNFIDR